MSRHERRFRAMGTDCHVVIEDGPSQLLDVGHRRIAELEGRWSRFIPDSELSLLSARRRMRMSPDSFRLLATALVGWRLSGGVFDPFLADAIVAAGYDRDYSQLTAASAPSRPLRPGARIVAFRPSARPVVAMDRRSGGVELGPRAAIDSGGIGKGLAADIVSAELVDAGARACLVNLGGDLRVRGSRAEPWQIAVAPEVAGEPRAELDRGEAFTIKLTAGGLATSSLTRRRWIDATGREVHHLLDPRTGRSVTGSVAAATAIAPSGWLAEVLSKAAILLDPEKAAGLVARHRGGAVTQGWDGRITQLTTRHRP